MLTAYVEVPAGLSKAMTRVANALKTYAPTNVSFVPEVEAQLVVLHVIGAAGLDAKLREIRRRGQAYAVIQYCLSSTGTPVAEWAPIWRDSRLTWSYYDLEAAAGVRPDVAFPFYYAPLGVDAVFTRGARLPKAYGVVTSGYVAGQQEAIDVCYEAAVDAGRRVFHLGPTPVGMPPTDAATWTAGHEISDDALALVYRSSDHVSGLRWMEGFELPVVEGLACGARPICFDLPVYRAWFDGLATFVPHDRARLRDAVAAALREPVPVTENESDYARNTLFDWRTIVRGFWERAR